jgi:hypothetical protein
METTDHLVSAVTILLWGMTTESASTASITQNIIELNEEIITSE